MEFITVLPVYLAVGAIAGLLAGMFGVGGGLIVVPALVMVLSQQQAVPSQWLMHYALATSLANIVFTSASSVHAQQRRGAIDWSVFAKLAPGIALGAFFAAQIAEQMASDWLQTGFAIAEVLLGIQMLLAAQAPATRKLPGTVGLLLVGVFVGLVSALAGIGGGSLMVPFLLFCSLSMPRAVALSAACGMPIALMGSIGYIIAGWDLSGQPDYTLGFVYLPALLGIASASMLCAPIGVRLVHRLPAQLLKRLFAALLICLGISLLVN